jgi:predicted AAA+ superfamily ATPase
MERAGKQASINKLANILKISPDTAKRYLHLFEETYLIYLIPRYGKTNETLLSSKKVYAADLGIRNLFTGFRDKGALFENIVFLKIKHLHPAYIYEEGIELDFMTEKKILIEVKYGKTLNDKQKELFDKIEAKEKFIIDQISELGSLDSIQT